MAQLTNPLNRPHNTKLRTKQYTQSRSTAHNVRPTLSNRLNTATAPHAYCYTELHIMSSPTYTFPPPPIPPSPNLTPSSRSRSPPRKATTGERPGENGTLRRYHLHPTNPLLSSKLKQWLTPPPSHRGPNRSRPPPPRRRARHRTHRSGTSNRARASRDPG